MRPERPFRPTVFDALWPWPGNAFLVLFGGWLLYMGSMTGVADLRTAFHGLAGVTALALLFGLRAALHPNERARRRAAATPPDPSAETAALSPGAEAGGRWRDQSAEPWGASPAKAWDEGTTPTGPAVPAPASVAQGVPRVAGEIAPAVVVEGEAMAERVAAGTPEKTGPVQDGALQDAALRGEPAAATEPAQAAGDAGRDSDPSQETPSSPSTRQGAAGEAGTTPALSPAAQNAPVAVAPKSLAAIGESFDVVAAMRQVEAALNREKAERGALQAKVDGLLAAGGTGGDGPTGATLEQRLENYLTIPTFNESLNKKLLPLVSKMINERIAAATQPEALWEKMGGGTNARAEGAAPGLFPDETTNAPGDLLPLIERVNRTNAEFTAATSALREEHGALVAEVRSARELAAQALEVAKGRAAEGAADRFSPAEGQALEDRLEETERRLDASVREAEALAREVREAIGAVTAQIGEIGSHNEALMNKVDAVQRVLRQSGTEDQPTTASAEVEALRAALTTIIEQNREIRDQQDALTARLGAPVDAPESTAQPTSGPDDRPAG